MRGWATGRRGAIALLLLAAAAVYASCLDYLFFGRVGDDSRHWLAALSLLEGRYVDLSHPVTPPLGLPLPGYPLLLAPAALLGSLRLAQWMNVLFLLGGVLAALSLLRREPAAGLAAAALAALNPLTVLQAGPLMTDPAFMAASLAALAALIPVLEPSERSRGGRVALAALLAAGCAWIRPQGIAVIGAGALTLLEDKATRRSAWLYVAMSLPLAAVAHLLILANAAPSDTFFAHLSTTTWRRGSPLEDLARTLWLNVRFYSSAVTTRTLLSWVAPVPGESSWAAAAAEAALLVALGWQLKRALGERGTPRLLAIYLVLYVGLHLFWTNQFRRYLFPILPVLYWLLLRPLERRPRALAGAAVAGLLFFCGLDGVLAWHSQAPRPNENVLPHGTLGYLRSKTAPGDVLASRYRETISYYCGRQAVDIGLAADPDDWMHELTRYRVKLVVNHPEGETFESVRKDLLQAAAALTALRLSDPARFKPVFRAPGEPFIVYELLDADRFERGYELLTLARESIRTGDLKGASVSLEAARRTGAALVRLPFYLGTTEMLLGRPKAAEPLLAEAARREPRFAPALANLERVRSAFP